MELNEMMLFFDVIVLGMSLYFLYTLVRVAVTGRLFQNGILVPKNKKLSDCTDEKAYIRYMMPPLAVTSVVATIYGVVMTLDDQLGLELLPYPWGLAPLVATLAALVWLCVRSSRANREYFGL